MIMGAAGVSAKALPMQPLAGQARVAQICALTED